MRGLRAVIGLAFTVAASVCHAGIDLYVTGGYGFAIGGEGPYYSEKRNNNITPYESQTNYLNLGKGIKIEGGALFGFHPNVALQLGLSGSFHAPGKLDEDITVIDWFGATTTTATSRWNFTSNIVGGRFQLQPRASLSDMLTLYCGLGGGFFYAFTESERTTRSVSQSGSSTTTTVSKETWEYENSLIPALTASMGMNINLAGPFSFLTEVSYESMNVVKKKEVYTNNAGDITTVKYERNATDRLASPKIPASNVSLRAGIVVSIL